jgi:hypothetical protein
MTPGTYWYTASTHQKQPPPKVAVAVFAGSGEEVGAAVITIGKIAKVIAESRIRFLMSPISSSRGKKTN